MPAFPFFLFGIVGVLAGAGDFRVIRSGARQGAARLRRHLWRMSFALFIAALSFFIGLLALPVLAVLVAMFYWLWRIGPFARTHRASRHVSTQRVYSPR
ncbi:MAG: hypothetical protein ACRENB_08820 [Gemmatimonadales bacterium]